MKRISIAVAEHGQTEYDKQHRVHGDTDSPLTETGKKQAAALGKRVSHMVPSPDRIYTSPLKRTVQTAKIAGKVAGIPVEVADGLKSLDVGKYRGIGEKDASKHLKEYFDHPDKPIPGAHGETVAGWRERVKQTMDRIAQKSEEAGEHPMAVTHSNVSGAIEAMAEGKEDGLKKMQNPPPNGSYRMVRYPLGKH